MKILYIIRHAKSSWDHPGMDDFQRPLNKRGRRDAPFIGKQLKSLEIKPDIILSSPANRAITTAKAFAQAIDYPLKDILKYEQIYHAGVKQLLKVIKAIDNKHDTVWIFGHNPGLTDLANFISNAQIDNIPTCGVFCVEFDTEDWSDIQEGAGQFKLFDYPKNYFNK